MVVKVKAGGHLLLAVIGEIVDTTSLILHLIALILVLNGHSTTKIRVTFNMIKILDIITTNV